MKLIGLTILSGIFFVNLSCQQNQKQMSYNKLTPDEERVIIHKGTEAPFSGTYYNHFDFGTYHCKQCNAALYKSDSKFESGCGWPSFDDEIAGAVKRIKDADGRRTEIVCTACGGHLGHVFEGEGFTPKNTRHCVNSISILFKEAEMKPGTEVVYFAGGCFWGVEYFLQKKAGVVRTKVGYMGGHTKNPTYKEVCNKNTGHAEVVEVLYDPRKISYETLAKVFFETHDPTQVNRQGPDIGDQYRSEIFYTTDKQRDISEALVQQLQKKGFDVVTKITKAPEFYVAEDYHQQYYEHKGTLPYCHGYVKRF